MAQISDKTDISGGCPQKIADRVLGIMGNRKSVNEEIGDFKTCTCFEEAAVELCIQVAFHFLFCAAIAIDRDVQLFCDADEAVDMVAMLVGDHDGGEAFGDAADSLKPLAYLARAEPGVNQDARLGGLDVGAIA